MKSVSRLPRRPRYRTLREDYVQFCDGNVVAALLLDYLASIERLHDEMRVQGERPMQWRPISGKFGGMITMLRPQPTRETIRRALDILIANGLVEAHPDNGKPTEPNTPPAASRYRLNGRVLLDMERDWIADAQEENGDFDDGVSAQTLGGLAPSRQGVSGQASHESVKGTEKKEGVEPPTAPDYEPPEVQRVRNDTTAQMNGYQLVVAYAAETSTPAETVWQTGKRVAAGLAAAGMTPEDVMAFLTEMRTTSFARFQGYRFNYMAEDLPRWKQQRAEKPTVTPAAERAALEAAERARIEWERERAAEWAQAAGGEL